MRPCQGRDREFESRRDRSILLEYSRRFFIHAFNLPLPFWLGNIWYSKFSCVHYTAILRITTGRLDLAKSFLRRFTRQIFSGKLFFLLIAADITFILLHLIYKFTPLLPDTLFSLTRDGSYSEYFQYLKELGVVVLLLNLAARQRRLLFASYAGLFLYFFADDFFQIHERAGESLANYIQLPAALGLRAQDFGELAVFGFFGFIFVLLIGLTHFLSDPHTRLFSRQLLLLVILLAVFGILFDMLEIGSTHPVMGSILGILDDGGEMIVMSLITVFVANAARQHSGPDTGSAVD